MGPLGWQETLFIFILALLIFGPRKLPELGRNIGKAIAEFRRASNELKATWDREMRNLEQETQDLRQIAADYTYESYRYDDSYNYTDSYDYDYEYNDEFSGSTAGYNSTNSTAAKVSDGASKQTSTLPSTSSKQESEASSQPQKEQLAAVTTSGNETTLLPAESDHKNKSAQNPTG